MCVCVNHILYTGLCGCMYMCMCCLITLVFSNQVRYCLKSLRQQMASRHNNNNNNKVIIEVQSSVFSLVLETSQQHCLLYSSSSSWNLYMTICPSVSNQWLRSYWAQQPISDPQWQCWPTSDKGKSTSCVLTLGQSTYSHTWNKESGCLEYTGLSERSPFLVFPGVFLKCSFHF